MTSYPFAPSGIFAACLAQEVRAALPAVAFTVRNTRADVNVSVIVDAGLSAEDEATLNATVAAHKAESAARQLASRKMNKCAEIDGRTSDLIAEGFTHAGIVFSLSANAQSYWTNLYQARAIFTATGGYPLRVNALDDSESYAVPDEADVEALYVAALGAVSGALGRGTFLKDSVRAAVTVEDVDAIQDTR